MMPKDRKIIISLVALSSFLAGAVFVLLGQMGLGSLPQVHAAPPASDSFDEMQDIFRRVAAENLPVVVEIDVLNTKEAGQEMSEAVPWDDFFSAPDSGVPQDRFDFYGLGSGVIVRNVESTYYVITNYHVVGDSEQIRVTFYDGREYEAHPVGLDSRKDLALISFETDEKDIPIARLGDSGKLYVGDWVMAIGNPLGYESSVTAGIISAVGREDAPDGNISDFIQTDAAINQGNSGGALLNMQGEVVGINSWISTSTGGSMGLGFSLPINNALSSIDDIIAYGKPRYGWLGVSMGDRSPQLAEEIGLEEDLTGAFVYQVFIGSPAWKGGVKAGDFIYSIDGSPVKNRKDLTYRIGEIEPESTVSMGVYRGGLKKTLSVTIDVREDEDRVVSSNSLAWPGITLLPLNEAIRGALGLDESYFGVIVEDAYAKTPFQKAGLQIGDIIESVNGVPIESLNDFYEQVGQVSESVFNLHIKRITDKVNEIDVIVERENYGE
ncbi:MAG: Do family serine endopeptidase [Spirochaetales bacterium]|nr:Do family serine endopeptidase [Spirochaetales bacterium]